MISCNSSIDFDKLSCGCFTSKTDLWILESGESHHITFDKNHLTKITNLTYPMLVKLPNGYRIKVTQIGEVTLAPEITFSNVLLIPSFKYNLISISFIAAHLKCITSFTDTLCLLQSPSLKRPL